MEERGGKEGMRELQHHRSKNHGIRVWRTVIVEKYNRINMLRVAAYHKLISQVPSELFCSVFIFPTDEERC
jgi:hypothetical protein